MNVTHCKRPTAQTQPNPSAARFWSTGVAVLCLAGVALVSGCSIGHTFNHEAASNLELGQITLSDYRSVFTNSPNTVSQRINANGTYNIVHYRLRHGNLQAITIRGLLLEFKDGKLNAFVHVSNFEGEKTPVPVDNMNQLKRGESSKPEVFRLLGKPNGKALCPSTLADFKDRCDGNSEIWTWQSLGDQPNEGKKTKPPATTNLYVSFDKTGVVNEIETASYPSR
jgi:hypothetical protein